MGSSLRHSTPPSSSCYCSCLLVYCYFSFVSFVACFVFLMLLYYVGYYLLVFQWLVPLVKTFVTIYVLVSLCLQSVIRTLTMLLPLQSPSDSCHFQVRVQIEPSAHFASFTVLCGYIERIRTVVYHIFYCLFVFSLLISILVDCWGVHIFFDFLLFFLRIPYSHPFRSRVGNIIHCNSFSNSL